eukprot:Gregarina_sp_Poly_1__516@NODE_1125_length_5012_cov_27_950051_g779_i0_p2_GENE_NODE_1125_length_5012_cov_27_950051_g779_i0NODE_1125_length_5012_cov_27_950051_g779_i0_p2_ORF_typecomplete_len453_score35_31_NODE_1125_length_5012_cov_27_950051_g779_i030114369
MSIGLCILAFSRFLSLSSEKLKAYAEQQNGLGEGDSEYLEKPWRCLLLFLSVEDLCNLERVSRSIGMAVRYYGYETYAISLIRSLGWTNRQQIPQTDLLNPIWATSFGLKYHLILIKMAKLCVCQIEGNIQKNRLDEELKCIRDVCEFLKEQRSVTKFSDPKTIKMLNSVLQLTSEHNTECAFSRDERSALTCLRIGLGKLTNTTLPAEIANASDIAQALGEPYEDPKRFFHTLLTELGKFVAGLRRLQKDSVRWYREILYFRNACSGSLVRTKKSLTTVRDVAMANEINADAWSSDITRMDRIEASHKDEAQFLYFLPEEKASITRMAQRRNYSQTQPYYPQPMRYEPTPTLPTLQRSTNHSLEDKESETNLDDTNSPILKQSTNPYSVQGKASPLLNKMSSVPRTDGAPRVGPYSVTQGSVDKQQTARPVLHPSLNAGSYSYFEPRQQPE